MRAHQLVLPPCEVVIKAVSEYVSSIKDLGNLDAIARDVFKQSQVGRRRPGPNADAVGPLEWNDDTILSLLCSLGWRTKWSVLRKRWSISQLPVSPAHPTWGPPPSSVSAGHTAEPEQNQNHTVLHNQGSFLPLQRGNIYVNKCQNLPAIT